MFAIALAATLAAPTTAPRPEPALTEIAQLEQRWGDAFLKRNHALLERLVAPEFRLVRAQPDGRSSVVPRNTVRP